MTDFRALCAELVEKLDELNCHYNVPSQSAMIERACAALADESASVIGEPSFDELRNLWANAPCIDEAPGGVAFARAVLARWGTPAPQPPAEEEVEELVVDELVKRLRTKAATEKANRCHYSAILLTRAADLLQRLSPPQPVPVSERLPVGVEQALIKAECALSDIAEGEPEENEGDADALLQWAEQRAATALSRIRPVMRLHGILTSEWPPLPAHALPVPAGEAVLYAAAQAMECPDGFLPYERELMAAALRAAALYSYCPMDRQRLAAIATELEGVNG